MPDKWSIYQVKYQGIRPAPGYPSQPDHTEKVKYQSLFCKVVNDCFWMMSLCAAANDVEAA